MNDKYYITKIKLSIFIDVFLYGIEL